MVYPHNQSLSELLDEKGLRINDSDKSEKYLEWTSDLEVSLCYSMVGHKPVGPNRFFQMYFVHQNFCSLICKDVDVSVIWKKLETMYDLATLDESESVTTKGEKFALSRSTFGELMEKAKQGLIETDISVQDINKSDNNTDVINTKSDDTNKKKEDLEEKNNVTQSKDTKSDNNGKTEVTPKAVSGKRDSKDATKGNTKEKKEVNSKRDIQDIVKGDVRDSANKKEDDKEVKKMKKDQKEIKKIPKKESLDKKVTEQLRKDVEGKKTESLKKNDSKIDVKPTRVESLKRESSLDKRKETTDKKAEVKSVEKKFESKNHDKKNDLNKSTDKKIDAVKTLDKRSDKTEKKPETNKNSDKKSDLSKSIEKRTEKKVDKKWEKSGNSSKTSEAGSSSGVKSPDVSKAAGKTPDTLKKVKEKKDVEGEKESFSLKRLRDSWSSDDTPVKRPKGRPTRNSGEAVIKTTSSQSNIIPGKRRRML